MAWGGDAELARGQDANNNRLYLKAFCGGGSLLSHGVRHKERPCRAAEIAPLCALCQTKENAIMSNASQVQPGERDPNMPPRPSSDRHCRRGAVHFHVRDVSGPWPEIQGHVAAPAANAQSRLGLVGLAVPRPPRADAWRRSCEGRRPHVQGVKRHARHRRLSHRQARHGSRVPGGR